MIQSFADKSTAAIFVGLHARKIPADINVRARSKLLALHSAIHIEDLRKPPSNHLEQLIGDRNGQHSIRINKRWHICFAWIEGNAYDVEIVDYH
ncbi:MAG: type II toxin-antitoxin system RelE/ParE family toxin [Acinetobacter sp.]|jgi:proteic killer suppression protein|nr:MAG: type II toxin-antitoxin system RelE/ParE family toxin [Acinetobacter sp.]